MTFCCLPRNCLEILAISAVVTQSKVEVVDLSADFRLRNVSTYATWYGKPRRTFKRRPSMVLLGLEV